MGITFDKDTNQFIFDFQHDGVEDIINLTADIFQIDAFGKCLYYGYEFSEHVDSNLRSALIKYVKFPESIQKNPNLTKFIQKAINNLNDKINLYDYNLVIMPESSSQVNQYMMRYLYRFAQPSLQYLELVKTLPANISFDMDAYEKQYLNDVLENGRPRYTEKQKSTVKASIQDMMDLIHKKDYFTIARDVRKSRMRPYLMRFLDFKTEEEKNLCASIRKQNILIIDDVTTSGSTLNEILRTLRILNEDNNIVIFSLIGKKDLMADSI